MTDPILRMVTRDGAAISIAERIKEACDASGFTVEEIRGPSREQPLARVRQWVMWRCIKDGHTTTKVGRMLGDRDHTTVIHGVNRIKQLYADEAVQ